MISAGQGAVPPEFMRALHALRDARLRQEIHLEEVPAPGRIAPYSVALTAEVHSRHRADEGELASGRFVALHDPAGQEAWDGTFRVVTLVRATLDDELGFDPLLSDVAWTWLQDAMSDAGITPHALGGTVTRVLSESFGTLADRAGEVEVEIRASWTPDGPELGQHLVAWGSLLCAGAGLEPLPTGVTALGPRR